MDFWAIAFRIYGVSEIKNSLPENNSHQILNTDYVPNYKKPSIQEVESYQNYKADFAIPSSKKEHKKKRLLDFLRHQLFEIRSYTTVTVERFNEVLENEGVADLLYEDYPTIEDAGYIIGQLIGENNEFEFDKFNGTITRKGMSNSSPEKSSYFFSNATNDEEYQNEIQGKTLNSLDPIITTNDFICPTCHNSIDKTSTFCKDCGHRLRKCLICKLLLKQPDQLGQCPHCQEVFHLIHLRESLKVTG
jgi:hypothetical protein